MIYSKTAEIAIRALLYLSQQSPGAFSSISQVAKNQRLSAPMLSKVLQRLNRHRLVMTQKGPGGGYALGKPAKNITLLNLINIIDGEPDWERCALGLEQCTPSNPCPLCHHWRNLKENIREYLEKTTLFDLTQVKSQHLPDSLR